MEKLHPIGKENLFEAVNCSPILSSGCTLEENSTKTFVYSPLSERNRACQGNSSRSPATYKTSKVGLLLNTPSQQPSTSLPVDSWEDIRKLDEDEAWIERTQVVTKQDHLLYCETAKEIVSNIIVNLPISNMDESNTEGDNIVLAPDMIKDNLVNGLDASNPSEIAGANAVDVVSEERKEDISTDMKDGLNTNENCVSSDQPFEKSGTQEDNDFIYSCNSDLDTTVKEVSINDESSLESTLLEDTKDLDETVKEISEDEQASSTNTLAEDKDLVDPTLDDDVNLQLDEGSFKPAAAFDLELDFLESCGNASGTDHVSDLARQSLYVKFDPLVEAKTPKESSQDTGTFPNINPADLLFQGPIASDDLLVMDTPPEKPVVSRRALLTQTPTTKTEEEGTVAPLVSPVDLFELSPSQNITATDKAEEETRKIESIVVTPEEDSTLVQPLQYSKKDLDKAVEEEKEKVMSQWNLQNSLHEAEIEKLLEERRKDVEEKNKFIEEKNKVIEENKVVKTLMMEYEQTMAKMIKDRENEQSRQEKSNSAIRQERDQLQRDLNNTEKSFAHLHEKFGKLKTAVESYRKNEEVLKKVVKDLQEDVKNSEAKYQVLKSHAEQKLHEANVEINRVQNTYKTELAGLHAALKRERTKNSSLQQSLDQKVNENKELTSICDELISKVGPIP